MAEHPGKKQDAKELLAHDVMPNMDLTKKVEITSSCSWRNVVIQCEETYQKLEDRTGRERCLQLLQTQSPRREDKWFAIYLQAFLLADYSEYTRAITTLQKIPQGIKYANYRDMHISHWKDMMRKNGNKPSPKRPNQ